ncbi:glycosyltransferase [Marispirochaeta aestuarii]|uniref:glycosyltransferase n=1 Tax=Marispirochaeta aestuarii TaxID=1963862 RepID=UPI0029C67690|nr:glycosyltransferase [Marispirochaeta aestuarii]
MAKVDLHVHSKYSDHPSEWFLQRLGTSESYTEPEYIYTTAKQRGMNLVTISDHNSIQGALELKKQHPEDCFVSVESTAYFPEDGCKIHILLFDITEEQFEHIEALRKDIYLLRDYIKEENIAYSVAHATYSVNGAVTADHLEKLILLFDVFETINGGRNERNNSEWSHFLSSLTREDTERLQQRHRIEPMSVTPWIKGFTAGSDDHAGIFIGKTWTSSEASTVEEFIHSIRTRKTAARGRHHNFHSMTFMIYKIAFDFLRIRHNGSIPGPVSLVLDGLFNEKELDLKRAFALKRIKKKKKKSANQRILVDLVEQVRSVNYHEIDARLDIVYEKASELLDAIIKDFIDSFGKHLRKGNFDKLMRNFSSLLPALFLSVPFISTFTHMFNNRKLVNEMFLRLDKEPPRKEKKILWFTDTLTELNGVAITVQEIGWIAHTMKKEIRIAAAVESENLGELPPNLMNIPIVGSLPLPHYEKLSLKVPSLLATLKLINDYDPDEIYISTPMTIGLTGLAAARLLNIPAVAIHHTDGTMQVRKIVDDITITNYVESYMKWFHSACDKTLVNTREYAEILKKRGYRMPEVGLFHRGVDTNLFKPHAGARRVLGEKYGIRKGVNLLYAGRISRDKSVDIVVDCFLDLKEEFPELNLIIAGEGPYADEMLRRVQREERVHFLGRVDHDLMPIVYAASDLFLFPSVTDTFGRVVAEAQSCGVPTIVSNAGGPQEIIADERTGRIVRTQSGEAWITATRKLLQNLKENPEEYKRMGLEARSHIIEEYSMQHFITGLFRKHPREPKLAESA